MYSQVVATRVKEEDFICIELCVSYLSCSVMDDGSVRPNSSYSGKAVHAVSRILTEETNTALIYTQAALVYNDQNGFSCNRWSKYKYK